MVEVKAFATRLGRLWSDFAQIDTVLRIQRRQLHRRPSKNSHAHYKGLFQQYRPKGEVRRRMLSRRCWGVSGRRLVLSGLIIEKATPQKSATRLNMRLLSLLLLEVRSTNFSQSSLVKTGPIS
jgi:hypothetical protein